MTPTTDITLNMTLHLSPRGHSIYEGIPYLIPVLTNEASVATAHIGGATILSEIGHNRSDHLAVIIGPPWANPDVRLAAVIKLRAYADNADVYHEMRHVPDMWRTKMPPRQYFDFLSAMTDITGRAARGQWFGGIAMPPMLNPPATLNLRVMLGVHYIVERLARGNGDA